MKRSAPLALALLLVSTLSSCHGFEEFLDENTVTEKAVFAGALIGGTPAIVALSPLTLPMTLASDSREGVAYLLFPGIPTAVLGGVALGLPVLALETIARLPARLWRRATGADLEPKQEPIAPEPEPEPEPDPKPESLPTKDDSPYRNWPKLGRAPQRVAWPKDASR